MKAKRMLCEFSSYSGWDYARKKPAQSISHHEVRVMAEAEGWVMVRRPRCIPFVVAKDKLKPIPAKP